MKTLIVEIGKLNLNLLVRLNNNKKRGQFLFSNDNPVEQINKIKIIHQFSNGQKRERENWFNCYDKRILNDIFLLLFVLLSTTV